MKGYLISTEVNEIIGEYTNVVSVKLRDDEVLVIVNEENKFEPMVVCGSDVNMYDASCAVVQAVRQVL